MSTSISQNKQMEQVNDVIDSIHRLSHY